MGRQQRQATNPPKSKVLEDWDAAFRELRAEYWAEVKENQRLRERSEWLERCVVDLEIKLGRK